LSHFLLASSYFLHLVATVVWLGGMALLVFIIWPAQKGSESPLVAAIEKRFRPFSNFSLLVLMMTGVVQTGQEDDYNGLLTFDTPWSKAILAKHIAFFGMVAIVGFLQFGLASTLERAKLLKRAEEVELLQGRERRLTRINLVLGMVVLIFTAIATAQ
jgi:uncharacterized membrane protein